MGKRAYAVPTRSPAIRFVCRKAGRTMGWWWDCHCCVRGTAIAIRLQICDSFEFTKVLQLFITPTTSSIIQKATNTDHILARNTNSTKFLKATSKILLLKASKSPPQSPDRIDNRDV